ncbi:LuxR C-terminal-related transcriptional regulator [Streptomyces sp. NPDC060031]|uniref:LuxR C-terminal-related transcriptional regulator n=1 Tax=Streptomyces sp. NPDC060031 TaxID=3347043 RepID=UPI0036C1F8B8
MNAVRLSRRERQIIQELAGGASLAMAAQTLGISKLTAKSYRDAARNKLGCPAMAPAMVAAAYDASALEIPAHDGSVVEVTDEQRELLPLLIAGLSTTQMSKKLHQHIERVRSNLRHLMAALGGKGHAHMVTRAYQLGLAGPRSQIVELHQSAGQDELVDAPASAAR